MHTREKQNESFRSLFKIIITTRSYLFLTSPYVFVGISHSTILLGDDLLRWNFDKNHFLIDEISIVSLKRNQISEKKKQLLILSFTAVRRGYLKLFLRLFEK